MVQNPGGKLGGFSIGTIGLFQSWDLDIKRQVMKSFLGSRPFRLAPRSPNRFELDMKAAGVDVAVGLPGFSAAGWWFVPAITGVLGAADVEIENPAIHERVTGTGWIAGGGLELAAVPSRLPRSYLAVGWQGWWTDVDDMDSDMAGHDSGSTPLTIFRDQTDLSSETNEVYLKMGYSFLGNRLTPFGGVKYRWSDLEVRREVRGSLDSLEFRFRRALDLELGRGDRILGLAGVDFRGPDVWQLGRVFGRVQTEFNGSGVSVLFKLMIGLGFMDP
jgi:hypothetical protein